MHRPRTSTVAASAGLFALALIILLRTMVPTVYSYDSGEFAIGAYRLGIVHAPGYPLYLLIGHVFTLLPFGDVAYRVNLLSAVALAGTVPLLFAILRRCVHDAWVAASLSLVFAWGYYTWYSGLHAEVYGPQAFSAALVGWLLLRFQERPNLQRGLLVGAAYGAAVALAPSSVLFAPGVAIAFLLIRCGWHVRIASGLLSLTCFAGGLAYFPLAAANHPVLNLAGQYDGIGRFVPVDLASFGGLYWILSGKQFATLFGFFPTLSSMGATAQWFIQNFLGVGVVLGILGLIVMKDRGRLLVWACLFIPVTYFFTAYGAVDRDTMFVPSYLLWTVMCAYGLAWLVRRVAQPARIAACIVLPAVFLAVNYPLVDSHGDTTIRDQAQATIDLIPPNATVLGNWFEIVPLQYLQMVEGQRPDLRLINLFLFDRTEGTLDAYIRTLAGGSRPIFTVGADLPFMLPAGLAAKPVRALLPLFGKVPTEKATAGYVLATQAVLESPGS